MYRSRKNNKHRTNVKNAVRNSNFVLVRVRGPKKSRVRVSPFYMRLTLAGDEFLVNTLDRTGPEIGTVKLGPSNWDR